MHVIIRQWDESSDNRTMVCTCDCRTIESTCGCWTMEWVRGTMVNVFPIATTVLIPCIGPVCPLYWSCCPLYWHCWSTVLTMLAHVWHTWLGRQGLSPVYVSTYSPYKFDSKCNHDSHAQSIGCIVIQTICQPDTVPLVCVVIVVGLCLWRLLGVAALWWVSNISEFDLAKDVALCLQMFSSSRC